MLKSSESYSSERPAVGCIAWLDDSFTRTGLLLWVGQQNRKLDMTTSLKAPLPELFNNRDILFQISGALCEVSVDNLAGCGLKLDLNVGNRLWSLSNSGSATEEPQQQGGEYEVAD
jgi:hypothetical protein